MSRIHPVQVIAVTGGKGGVGKTSVAINLGVSLAMLGRRVALLDADLGLANVDVLLGLTPKQTLEDVLAGRCGLLEVMITGPGGIRIIPSSSGTQRMAQLSRHLTSFARKPGEGAGPIGLAAVFDEVLGLLQGRLERAGIAPRISGLDGETVVVGGMVRLQHVFMNMIANAIDAVAGNTDPSISVTVERHAETVTVAVEDNGPGIAEGDIERVFDPFFTTKAQGKGLGLGLSISFNIVRDFGGTLRAENRPEGGARFVVTLRRAGAPSAEAAE